VTVRLPFGKYKGDALEDVPLNYLIWLLDSCDLLDGLAGSVRREVGRRVAPLCGDGGEYEAGYAAGYAAGRRAGSAGASPPWREVVGAWFRPLALLHHPDRGGNPGVMAALNDARERLERQIASALEEQEDDA
jgi:hypothetical protein